MTKTKHARRDRPLPKLDRRNVINKTKNGINLSRSNTTIDQVTLRSASQRGKRKVSMPKLPWDIE